MPSRYVCDVLSEMREMVKDMRFDRASGLINEAQTMVNKMESALEDYSSLGWSEEKHSKVRKELRIMKLKRKVLSDELSQLEECLEECGSSDNKNAQVLAASWKALNKMLSANGDGSKNSKEMVCEEINLRLKELGVDHQFKIE